MKRILPFFVIFAVVRCGPVSSESNEVTVWKIISECLESQNGMLCAKEKALKITDRLRSLKQLEIVDGVILSNTEPSRTARSKDISSLDPNTREAQIDESIVDNVEDLLDNVVLQFKLPGASDDEGGRQLKEGLGGSKKGGGKKNKGKELISLILKAKLFALIPVFLAIIAITLVKKVIMAKIAFFVIAIVLLKTLIAKKHHHSSHEVWAAPVPIHSGHGGGHGGWEGWDRTKVEASNMAYGSHIKS